MTIVSKETRDTRSILSRCEPIEFTIFLLARLYVYIFRYARICKYRIFGSDCTRYRCVRILIYLYLDRSIQFSLHHIEDFPCSWETQPKQHRPNVYKRECNKSVGGAVNKIRTVECQEREVKRSSQARQSCRF